MNTPASEYNRGDYVMVTRRSTGNPIKDFIRANDQPGQSFVGRVSSSGYGFINVFTSKANDYMESCVGSDTWGFSLDEVRHLTPDEIARVEFRNQGWHLT